jgi:hypothetical protein
LGLIDTVANFGGPKTCGDERNHFFISTTVRANGRVSSNISRRCLRLPCRLVPINFRPRSRSAHLESHSLESRDRRANVSAIRFRNSERRGSMMQSKNFARAMVDITGERKWAQSDAGVIRTDGILLHPRPPQKSSLEPGAGARVREVDGCAGRAGARLRE